MAYEYSLGFEATVRVRGYHGDDGENYHVVIEYDGQYEESAIVGAITQNDATPQKTEPLSGSDGIHLKYSDRDTATAHVETLLETARTLFLDERPSYDDPVFEAGLGERVESRDRFNR